MIRKKLVIDDCFDLDTMLQTCAQGALRNARLGKGWKSGIKPSSIERSPFSTLIECYARSPFAYSACRHKNKPQRDNRSDSDYLAFIEHNFRQYLEENLCAYCGNQEHFNLVLPVIFFSLIVQNEAHPDTVDRRALKVRENGANNLRWQHRNPYVVMRTESALHTLEKKEDVRLKAYYLEASTVLHNHDENELIPSGIRQNLFHLTKIADEYKLVSYLAAQARIGTFLADLLKSTHDTRKPLDTVLRMYMILELHDIFSFSRLFLADDPLNEINNEETGLLLRFFSPSEPLNEHSLFCREIPLFCFMEQDVPDTAALLNRPLKQRDKFPTYYEFLKKNFDWDIPGFVDFFLDEDVLKRNIDIDRKFDKYLSAIIQLIDAIPNIKDIYGLSDTIGEMGQLISKLRVPNQDYSDWENDQSFADNPEEPGNLATTQDHDSPFGNTEG